MNYIRQNIEEIREKIATATARCGRPVEEISLLAVSKTFSADLVAQAAEAGICMFGENRIQEAAGKIPQLSSLPGLQWHLIGHLQINKAKRAAELFDVVHSVDSIKLASRLNESSLSAGKILSVFIQVDLAGEETKFGAEPQQLREIVAAMPDFHNLQLNGLMTIPPYFDDSDQVRPYFSRLREIRDALEAEQPGCLGMKHLSMGMSHDFEQAIEEGATILRIGTAIFGRRT
jgi:pyridoxal phosphate enzyme (YggS family)